jgi:hypothetical protein
LIVAGFVVLIVGVISLSYGLYVQSQLFPSLPVTYRDGPAVLAPDKTPDINHDGIVNIKDAEIIAAAWGSHCANYEYPGQPASKNWNASADLNDDGVVDKVDVAIFTQYWNAKLSILDPSGVEGQTFMSGLVLVILGLVMAIVGMRQKGWRR